MITDVHTHIWETPDQLGRGAATHIRRHVEQPWDRPDASISAHETAMEPVQTVLIHGFESRHLGASVSAKQVASHVARHPYKYIGFAGVDPLGDYRSQIKEAQQLGLAGVTICPAGQACHPAHSRAMKLYQLCVDLKMPVFVHGATHLGGEAKLEFAQPYLFDEVARALPELRLVISQIGYPWIDQGLTLIGKHEHVYAEISNVVTRPWQLYNTLLTAHQLNVTDRLLFGSDYPFCTPEKAITTVYSVNTLTQGTPLPTVPREKLRSIIERDVLACLGLKKVEDSSAKDVTDEEEAIEVEEPPKKVIPKPKDNGRDKKASVPSAEAIAAAAMLASAELDESDSDNATEDTTATSEDAEMTATSVETDSVVDETPARSPSPETETDIEAEAEPAPIVVDETDREEDDAASPDANDEASKSDTGVPINTDPVDASESANPAPVDVVESPLDVTAATTPPPIPMVTVASDSPVPTDHQADRGNDAATDVDSSESPTDDSPDTPAESSATDDNRSESQVDPSDTEATGDELVDDSNEPATVVENESAAGDVPDEKEPPPKLESDV